VCPLEVMARTESHYKLSVYLLPVDLISALSVCSILRTMKKKTLRINW